MGFRLAAGIDLICGERSELISSRSRCLYAPLDLFDVVFVQFGQHHDRQGSCWNGKARLKKWGVNTFLRHVQTDPPSSAPRQIFCGGYNFQAPSKFCRGCFSSPHLSHHFLSTNCLSTSTYGILHFGQLSTKLVTKATSRLVVWHESHETAVSSSIHVYGCGLQSCNIQTGVSELEADADKFLAIKKWFLPDI